MVPDSPRSEQANADVLLWQTGYRLALALLGSVVAITLFSAGVIRLSSVAETTIGRDAADWILAVVSFVYVMLVVAIRYQVKRTSRAGRTVSSLMIVADLAIVFWLVFLLAEPHDYQRALLISLFSLQLSLVYFGRASTMLVLLAIAASYMLLVEIAIRHGGDVTRGHALISLAIFGVGASLVIVVQSNLHRRLATLVGIFERAEDGDFTLEYDVSADARPDALTVVGRAYNQMRTQLASIVLNDPLSGCFNRRGFEQQFRRELSRAARAHTDLALVSIDLDHFKAINDNFGHLVGDRVIAETGEVLRANARAEDLVARTGGEEFIILAPNTSIAGAHLLALRIVEAFRRRSFGEPDGKVTVTVSIGVVADSVANEDIAEDLRARADEALYAAKRTGRNRVVLWSHGLDALRLGQTGEITVPAPPADGAKGHASSRH